MAPRDAVSHANSRKVVSVEELRKHSVAGDGWVAIRGKVYDVSKFDSHPGGRVLLSALGQADSTDVFAAFHSAAAYAQLKEFYIGELEGPAPDVPVKRSGPASEPRTIGGWGKDLAPGEASPFELEYRKLLASAKAEGLFKASVAYYVWKVLSTTAIGVVAAGVTLYGKSLGSVAVQLGGAVLLALFWQQCGWLAHDFAHHQVFKTRSMNDVLVLVIGNLYQGFSCEWWKNKHNTHHAIPNLLESTDGAHDGDPDIDTLPFLAWSKAHVAKALPGRSEDSAMARFMVRWQALFYFPILLFARITWAVQSFAFAYKVNAGFFANSERSIVEKAAAEFAAKQGKTVTPDAASPPLRYDAAEKALIAVHYGWVLSLAFGGTTSLALGLLYLLVAETACGLFLAVPFGVGHNGMAIHEANAKPGFAELQCTTTRNVHDNCFGLTGWFTGGLHYQVEHHLFPMIPRHNLAKIAPRMRALCKKHGVTYHATGLWEGTWEILTHLKDVTDDLKDFPNA